MRKYIVGAVLAIGILTGVVGLVTMAGCASSKAAAINSFTTGAVTLAASPSSELITLDSMAPGDRVTSPITVGNNGSLSLRYAMSSTATNNDSKGVKDRLVLVVKSGVTTCTNSGFSDDGVLVYTGDMDSTDGKIIGDETQGQQTGDRTLAPGESETLCFQAFLPMVAAGDYKTATTTATFTFNAE